MSTIAQSTKLNVRLQTNNKKLVEQAAAAVGQTVSAFAASALVREAEDVVKHFGKPCLSDQDRNLFMGCS